MTVSSQETHKQTYVAMNGIALLVMFLGAVLIVLSFVQRGTTADVAVSPEDTAQNSNASSGTERTFSFISTENGFSVVVPGSSFAPRVDKIEDSTYGVSTFRFTASDQEPVSLSVYPEGTSLPLSDTLYEEQAVVIQGLPATQYREDGPDGPLTVTVFEHGGNAYRISGSGDAYQTILSHFQFTQ